MLRQDKIDKIPKFCAGPDELQAGDLLIFNSVPWHINSRQASGTTFTVTPQGILNERGGHNLAEHTAFVVETDDGLKLAHVIADGFIISDLHPNPDIDPETDPYSKYLKRTANVYRPRKKFQKALADELKQIVKEVDHDKEARLRAAPKTKLKAKASAIKWEAGVAVTSFLSRLVGPLRIADEDPYNMTLAPGETLPENIIDERSICSKFVAEAYISACNRMSNKDGIRYSKLLMNIKKWTVPKTLQAYLYRNSNYDFLVMPHDALKLYDNLMAIIVDEIVRLKSDKLPAAKQKGFDLEMGMINADKKFADTKDLMQKSIALLKEVLPILKRNTRHNIATPKSYSRVMNFAKEHGIYSNNFEHDLHDRSEGKVRQLAKDKYHFNDALAGLYRNYKRIGYSDEEARFECKPSFGEWFKLSPVRNILLSCTGLGFLFWVLPRGWARTYEAKVRNQKSIIEPVSQVRLA